MIVIFLHGMVCVISDAKGQEQSTSYDVFGRVASRTGPQGTTAYTYYYDAWSQKGNDNPTEITGFNVSARPTTSLIFGL